MDRGATLLILAAAGVVAIVVKAAQNPRHSRVRRKYDPVDPAERRQFLLILGAVFLLVTIPLFMHYVLGWHV